MESPKESCLKMISEADVVYLSNHEMRGALAELVKNTTDISESYKWILVQQLLEREKQGSTMIAPKVALAHTESNLVGDLILSFGFSTGGNVEWSLESGDEVKIIILLLFPINGDRSSDIEVAKHLMSKLANQKQMEKMINLKDAQNIKKILIEKN